MADDENLHEGQLRVEVQSTGIDVNVTSSKITLDDPDLEALSGMLRPAFGSPANAPVIGLLILALAEVIRYGARVEEEQAGTV